MKSSGRCIPTGENSKPKSPLPVFLLEAADLGGFFKARILRAASLRAAASVHWSSTTDSTALASLRRPASMAMGLVP
jgi:hypothetical protein